VTLQETRFPDKQTVREMVRLFRSFYHNGLDPADVLATVSLDAKANEYVEQLSGGQRQRLAVAIALVGDPELLFLDEPTTGLDPQSRRQLWDVIRGLHERGRTTILTTHYMDEAERLCDRVAIIHQGEIVAMDTPQALLSGLGGEIVELRVEGDGPAALEILRTRAIAGDDAFAVGSTLTVPLHDRTVADAISQVHETGVGVSAVNSRTPTLDDVYLRLTGGRIAVAA
jgi:ABC-2 type transport system ATP-binding protein